MIEARGSMIKRKRSKPRRVSVSRSRKYLAFLREFGVCDACGLGDEWGLTQACHGPVNGMASKGSDFEAIPLCPRHHREQHQIGWDAFCIKYAMDRAELVEYWNIAFVKEMKL